MQGLYLLYLLYIVCNVFIYSQAIATRAPLAHPYVPSAARGDGGGTLCLGEYPAVWGPRGGGVVLGHPKTSLSRCVPCGAGGDNCSPPCCRYRHGAAACACLHGLA